GGEVVADVVETAAESRPLHPARWPAARLLLLAAWRPVRTLSRTLDEMSHAWRTPFIELVTETPYLRVGPVVVPGLSACSGCAERRARQHSQRPNEHQALREFYDANPEQGPHGFLPALAEIGAVQLAEFVRQLEHDPARAAGRVWRMNIVRRETTTGTVVGIHGCARCGLRRDEGTRSFERLARVTRHLLQRDAALAEMPASGRRTVSLGTAASCAYSQ